MVVEAEEADMEGEDGEGEGGGGAEVPFAAKRAARVSSAWEMKLLLPVKSARR